MINQRHLPIVLALGASVLVGVSLWLPHARHVEALAKLMVAGCSLTWVWLDAGRRGVGVGNWMGLLVLALLPVGLLVWFVRYWRGRFWVPMLIYLGLQLAWVVLSFAGFFLMGLCLGLSFTQMITFL